MRHRKKINHLGRQKAHRQSMLSNMAVSLIMKKRIQTTVAKAKALRSFIEPLITKSKEDNTHSRRIVFSYLQDKNAVTELFRNISQKIADRPGGYTRILKTGTRSGDSADMCYIELVDYNTVMLEEAEKKEKKTSRRRRGAKKGKAADAPPQPQTQKNKEPKPEEEPTNQVAEEQTAHDAQQSEENVQHDFTESSTDTEQLQETIISDNKPLAEEPTAEASETPSETNETENTSDNPEEKV